jgi:cell division topological specificity factor
MGLSQLIDKIFGRVPEKSGSAAKDRLRLVLMHDRSDIPATMMEAIRAEMVQVLSKYVEIDNESLEVALEKEEGSIGLVLNIPIKRVKTEEEAAEAIAAAMAKPASEETNEAKVKVVTKVAREPKEAKAAASAE